ncbi:MAG: DNA translocase FtsK [Oscillospiraceae bacterium]|nr:DNA translocase FtsK [Oscillospiraceae bacterium]
MPAPKKQTKPKKPAAPAKKPPRRREIGAVVCLLLGVFSFLAYFASLTDVAWLLRWLRDGISGLVGWGFFAVPPALFFIMVTLAFHRGQPVRLRVLSTATMPVFVGALLHLFLSHVDEPFGTELMGILWETGQEMDSGGVMSGLLATFLENMLSIVGAAILLVLLLAFFVLLICRKSPADIADWFKNRERPEYEPEYDDRAHAPAEPPQKKKRRPPMIDIPVDGETPSERTEPPGKPGKKGIKLRRPGVATPDEFLAADQEGREIPVPPVREERSEFARQFDIPFSHDEHVPDLTPHQPAAPMPKVIETPIPEAGFDKLKPKEVAEARADIAKDIAEHAVDEFADYKYPDLSLLRQSRGSNAADGKKEVALNAERLDAALGSFGIEANIVNATRGPSVTRYELELEPGMKLSKLTNLAGDLALSLGVSSVRIAPIPNKISTVGIEVPNKVVSMVHLRDVIESSNFQTPKGKLTFALGKDISGTSMVGNIAKLPHLLIAGTTGSGKSVTMNSLILSVLYKARPDEVKFIMIDPKMVEFGIFNGIPHLLIPVVTDPKKAAGALQWAVTEMLKRYNLFKDVGVRDLETYNRRVADQEDMQTFPQLVVVIDELADLMIVASKEVEESICRVAQMGRAAGIHLVIATQRPSADVITGLMKANIPSRIALSVSSSMESRIIMDENGADKLVGNGDMLYKPVGGKPTRIQGTFVSDEERERVIDFLKAESAPQYDDAVDNFIEIAASEEKGASGTDSGGSDHDYDEMFDDAVQVVLDLGQASTSVLQRRLKLGYSRAARLIDQLEEAGVVGPFEGSKPRKLMITRAQWQARQAGEEVEDAGGEAPVASDHQAFAAIPRDDFSDLESENKDEDSFDD